MVDPDGRDDRFNEEGEFVERTETGSDVLVMCDGQYKNITEVDFSNNTSTIENIGRHYLGKNDKSDFNVTVSSMGDNTPKDVTLSFDTRTQDYGIHLTDGYVHEALGNYYNFECAAYHEYTHRYDNSTLDGMIGEALAIIRTANECPAWSNASDSYIDTQVRYAQKSLNQYGIIDIIPNDIVQSLNNAFIGSFTFGLDDSQQHIFHSNLLRECIVPVINPQK